jgi:Holliday junction resolvasome RuvABC DNA-binding subunit
VRALVALGYPPPTAASAVREILDADPAENGTEHLIRAALASLAAKQGPFKKRSPSSDP